VVPPPAVSPLLAAEGWLYNFLTWAGVDHATAHHLQDVVVKPLTVVLIILGAAIVAWLGARIVRHWVGAVARRAAGRAESPRAAARATTITALVANTLRVVVSVIAFFLVLGTIGLNLTPLLAGATVVGATIGFGAQSVVRDVLAGFLLIVEDQFDIGDSLTVGTTSGTVEDLSLRVTRLRGIDGTIWFVPNGEIRTLANTSRGWSEAMVDMAVPATADPDAVLRVLAEAATAVTDDPRYATSCLAPPRVWGVVASDAATTTVRVSIRVTLGDRDRVGRAVREETARRLHAIDAFAPPGTPPS
jgi:moderate conductance mechanosensitive channel